MIKLEPRAIKYVFVGYLRTQKGYRSFNPVHRKFYISIEVIFFELFLYFVPTTSLIPQFMPIFGIWREIVPKLLHVYTRRSNDVLYSSLPANLESTTADPNPPHSLSAY